MRIAREAHDDTAFPFHQHEGTGADGPFGESLGLVVVRGVPLVASNWACGITAVLNIARAGSKVGSGCFNLITTVDGPITSTAAIEATISFKAPFLGSRARSSRLGCNGKCGETRRDAKRGTARESDPCVHGGHLLDAG